MFGGVGIQYGLEQLRIEYLRHQFGNQLFFARLENKIAVGGPCFLFHFGDREEFLQYKALGGGILKFAVHDLHSVEFLILECLHGSLSASLDAFKIEVEEDIFKGIGDLVVIFGEV